MHYIIQILAAMLIGIAFGAVLGPRKNILFIGSLVTIALGLATIITVSWVPLAIGTAIFLVAKSVQRDALPSRA